MARTAATPSGAPAAPRDPRTPSPVRSAKRARRISVHGAGKPALARATAIRRAGAIRCPTLRWRRPHAYSGPLTGFRTAPLVPRPAAESA
jgi:hypothetical protein